MKKPEIAKRLARRSGISTAEAADNLDRMVTHILESIRKGRDVSLPGLGHFVRNADGALVCVPQKEPPRV